MSPVRTTEKGHSVTKFFGETRRRVTWSWRAQADAFSGLAVLVEPVLRGTYAVQEN